MKLIIYDCLFKGINPFEKGVVVPIASQYVGINETARWFLNDIEVYGKDRETLNVAMNNLLQFFYDNRYCDKPTETSLCTFYFRESRGLENCKNLLRIAESEAFASIFAIKSSVISYLLSNFLTI